MLWQQIKSQTKLSSSAQDAAAEISSAAILHFMRGATAKPALRCCNFYDIPQIGKPRKFRMLTVVDDGMGWHLITNFGSTEYLQYKAKVVTGQTISKPNGDKTADPIWGFDTCKTFPNSGALQSYVTAMMNSIKQKGENIGFVDDLTRRVGVYRDMNKAPMYSGGIPVSDVPKAPEGTISIPMPWAAAAAAASVVEPWSGDW